MADTDWAESLDQPSLKERASAALEKRVNDKRREWEEELFCLWDDSIAFFNDKLLFSKEELDDFIENGVESVFDGKARRPFIQWSHDGFDFKIGYVTEEVATIQRDSGTRTEKVNDIKLHVAVENRRGGWKRIESLADLGELVQKWI
jgi:hypothetical protein